eukprot:gnl/MRDRNA2_/MRDRNA2_95461_c0_seq1.p1 gnl/MRDRNA2_/MRDRNA2_95461_c0~~gnl/MRDRNA2_/MRDRNA2_95461_c0_seq1.p1  ORF type:complete len:236 (+),score=64.58 gnl/MRDRNA2_/MRDRNA2_95461_c0_seq1:97-804(+)
MAAEEKFNADGKEHRCALEDHFKNAKKEYKGSLSFSGYMLGHDNKYLGFMGKTYYAKPYGNDSSNLYAALAPSTYWKRVYYRPDLEKRFAQSDDAKSKGGPSKSDAKKVGGASSSSGHAAAGSNGMQKSASDSALPAIQQPVAKTGYAKIKAEMKDFVEQSGKPKIAELQQGERLNFFNTLGPKYYMKAGGKNLQWNVSRSTHRSSPKEVKWIISNYFRTDTLDLLKTSGSSPAL